MAEELEIALRVVLIGAGATIVMDIWLFLLKRLGIPTLDIALLGRWVGHLPRGQWAHDRVANASPITAERWLGWAAHYAIGVAFALLQVSVWGLAWGRSPTLLPAVLTGVATVAAPLFVLQPALGAGIASSRTKTPVRNIAMSLANHAVFGIGLYLAAVVSTWLIPTSLTRVSTASVVTRGLDPRVHAFRCSICGKEWIAGSSPAMTSR